MNRQLQDLENALATTMVDREGTTRQASREEIRRALKSGRPVYRRIVREATKEDGFKYIDITEATK